jgi:hypothetical protein
MAGIRWLLINRRWVISADALPDGVVTGDEQDGDFISSVPGRESVASSNGWGYAKLGLGKAVTLTIPDTKAPVKSPLSYEKTVPQFTINVPDKRFQGCMEAQTANLLMGYIGRQTGPGEPVNYPLAWERDGAYSLMAMAKSGNLQTARELSIYFAENDFFGGFGAEGDAPGSAISALTEVALVLDDPEYARWLWPHLQRKLLLIDEMINATNDVYKPFLGPLVPYLAARDDVKRRSVICTKADSGLINGAMDLHYPAVYVTALSYRGLTQASRTARRLGKQDVVEQCTAKAAKLKAAWTAAFGRAKYGDERNYIGTSRPFWALNRRSASVLCGSQ